ncbi:MULTISPECIES: hypothetical protein [Thermomonosporaceae]|uniref:hypothetical protein n=1 Tax=Thermomonosporaceae TaxID=2012 RepID=UPI00255B2C78|nr:MULTISPECIES: hypothetical protein [Thermomonosporaceae]MDL4770690.1 hypothetical protein [Actinomadura xylanilytica]
MGYRERRRFRSASVVKVLIALDHLRSGRDEGLLGPMLRSSDDAAASELWRRGGQGEIIERMVARAGLAETAPPPAEWPGFWGYTAVSAADVVRMYRYVLDEASERDRELVMGHLERATPCGSDGFDQTFGIPRALGRPWAVKQGWAGFGEEPDGRAAPGLGLGRPVLHTSGVVGDRIVVVLTLHPAGTSFRTASARLTTLTRQVHRAAG